MSHLLQPSNCRCYNLRLPSLPADADGLDENSKQKLLLECRTGAATVLLRSNVFVTGGLTIPLNLKYVSLQKLQEELIKFFAQKKTTDADFNNLSQYISPETFYLDLISRTWRRVITTLETSVKKTGSDVKTVDQNVPTTFKERLFHAVCYTDSCLYVFGGLIVDPENEYRLTPTNTLIKLNLQTKIWSVVSQKSSITNRFGHSMHVKNEDDDENDTKLVIVGGFDENDQPLQTVDIYNVTKDCWEFEIDPAAKFKYFTNVNRKKFSIDTNKNFSILVDNNQAKVPALTIYYPEEQITSNDTKQNDDKFDFSPFVALPLRPDSRGIRMGSSPNQDENLLKTISKLSYPSGGYYGYNIICIGFHPDCQSYNLHCYSYNIQNGKWSQIDTTCPDYDITNNRHRFWKLFVWSSHHEVLLLGTKTDDGNLPVVQKFDYLSTISLPMIDIDQKNTKTEDNLLTSMDRSLSYMKSNSDAAPKASQLASSNLSQFLSYIRYISPTSDVATVKSVFPPDAIVLGKDSFEIFGNSLADFEFVTDQGERVGVPMYLLRKRWGRYFHKLLAQGYEQVCTDLDDKSNTNLFSKLCSYSLGTLERSKFTPYDSPAPNTSLQNEYRRRSLSDAPMYTLDESTLESENIVRDNKPKTAVNKETVNLRKGKAISLFDVNGSDVKGMTSSKSLSPRKQSFSLSVQSPSLSECRSTTSSSNGMVFRVPFIEGDEKDKTVTSNSNSNSEFERRKSINLGSNIKITLNKMKMTPRHMSQPNISQNAEKDGRRNSNYLSAAVAAKMPQHLSREHSISSRRTSINSQVSSHSFVSSSSRRYSVGNVSNFGVLKGNIPSQLEAPNVPLPKVPSSNVLNSRRRSSLTIPTMSVLTATPMSSSKSYSDARSHASKTDNLSQYGQSGSDTESIHYDNPRPYFKNAFSKSSPGVSRKNSVISSENKPAILSSAGSFSSVGSNLDSGIVTDIDPLLLPRALYMPWSTSTVKALAEFFYTGQVNPKWSITPINVDLLIIAKTYEIPLLYSLVFDNLYSVICKKEQFLWKSSEQLTLIINKELEKFGDNAETSIEKIELNVVLDQLHSIQKSLQTVDSGWLDEDFIKHTPRTASLVTNEKSDDALHDLNLGALGTHSSLYYNLETRGSMQSHNSLMTPTSAQNTRNSSVAFNRYKKPSALKIKDEDGHQQFYHDLNLPTDIEENWEQEKLRELLQLDSESKPILQQNSDYNGVAKMLFENFEISSDTSTTSTVSSSELDFIDFAQFGTEKKSNDPRKKIMAGDGSSSLSLKSMTNHAPATAQTTATASPAPGTPATSRLQNSNKRPSLESTLAPDALPPSDTLVKSIYKNAVLVNDTSLIFKSLKCLHIFKNLRKTHKQLMAVLHKDDKSQTQTSATAASPSPSNRRPVLGVKAPAPGFFTCPPFVRTPSQISPKSSVCEPSTTPAITGQGKAVLQKLNTTDLERRDSVASPLSKR